MAMRRRADPAAVLRCVQSHWCAGHFHGAGERQIRANIGGLSEQLAERERHLAGTVVGAR
jgi:hypothetical protein